MGHFARVVHEETVFCHGVICHHHNGASGDIHLCQGLGDASCLFDAQHLIDQRRAALSDTKIACDFAVPMIGFGLIIFHDFRQHERIG